MARIPLIEKKEGLALEHHSIYDAIVESRGAVRGSFPALLHSPPIADYTARLGAYIRFESQLEPKIRALAALTAARELECRHEWASHVRNAERNGISRATVRAIHERKPPAELADDEAEIVSYVQELLRSHRVSDETYRPLLNRLGVNALVELTATIGYYAMVSCTMNAFELASDPQPEEFPI